MTDPDGAAVGMPLAASGSTMIVGDPHPRTVIAMNKILRADSQRLLTACEDQRLRWWLTCPEENRAQSRVPTLYAAVCNPTTSPVARPERTAH